MKAKYVAGALVIALLFPILGGCSSSQDNLLDAKNPTAITLWHYYNGDQKNAFDALVLQFNETLGAEKGIVVDAVSQGSVDELMTKAMDAADKKVGADPMPHIFGAYADTAYAMRNMDLLANIDQYLSEEELAAFVPAYINEGLDSEGHHYIFPIAKSTENLVIDDISWQEFAQATGAQAESLSTWEGMAQIAEDYYNWTDAQTPEENDGKAFGGLDAFANYMLIGAYQMGQEMFKVQDGQVTYNIDEATMRKLWDNYYVPFIKGYYAADGRFRSDDIKTGLLIAMVCSTSGSVYFPSEVEYADGTRKELSPKVLSVPVFAGYDPVAVQQGAGMVITKSDEKHEYASTVFLNWFVQSENNIPYCIRSGYLPVLAASNNKEAVDKILAEEEESISDLLLATIHNGIDTVNNYELYTSKAFENGNTARNIVGASLPNKAALDRSAVAAAMEEGMGRDEALAPYLSDENFTAWLESLRQELAAL